MPLQDTLDVMWVLEEALGQLGITMAEAPVELSRDGRGQRRRLLHSIAGHVSITIGDAGRRRPPERVGVETPSWNQTPLAPTATAWSANSPAASERRKTSTTSIGNGTSASVA